MFVIMAVATDTRAVGEAAAIAIGGTVGLDAMFGGPISGASMNPARSLGPGARLRRPARALALPRRAARRRGARRARLPVRSRGSTRMSVTSCSSASRNGGRCVMAERSSSATPTTAMRRARPGSDARAAAHPEVLDALGELGIDASDHVPRQLDPGALDWADVVVATLRRLVPLRPRQAVRELAPS